MMIDNVDDDKSGEVEFPEFIKIISNDKYSAHPIEKFFKDMANDKIGDKELGFAINV